MKTKMERETFVQKAIRKMVKEGVGQYAGKNKDGSMTTAFYEKETKTFTVGLEINGQWSLLAKDVTPEDLPKYLPENLETKEQ